MLGPTAGGAGEAGDGGADERHLHDVVAAAHRGGAVPLANPHFHVGGHHAFGAEPSDVLSHLPPGVPPRLVHQLGPAGHLGVARPRAPLPGGRPVVMPRPDRDAEHQAGRHPAGRDQPGEVLPGQSGSKGKLQPRGARRAHRGADGRELKAAEEERPAGQPDPHDPVAAERGALGGHPVNGRAPGLVHGFDQRPETTGIARRLDHGAR
jgi:hypothetical protein